MNATANRLWFVIGAMLTTPPIQGQIVDDISVVTIAGSDATEQYLHSVAAGGEIGEMAFIEGSYAYPCAIVSVATRHPSASQTSIPTAYADCVIVGTEFAESASWAVIRPPKLDASALWRKYPNWGDGANKGPYSFLGVLSRVVDAAWMCDGSLVFTWRVSPAKEHRDWRRSYLLKREQDQWTVRPLEQVIDDCRAFAAISFACPRSFVLSIKFETNGQRTVEARFTDGTPPLAVTYPSATIPPTIRRCATDWSMFDDIDLDSPSSTIEPGLWPNTVMTTLWGKYGWECRHVSISGGNEDPTNAINTQLSEMASEEPWKSSRLFLSGPGGDRRIILVAPQGRSDSVTGDLVVCAVQADPGNGVAKRWTQRIRKKDADQILFVDSSAIGCDHLLLRPSPVTNSPLAILNLKTGNLSDLSRNDLTPETTRVFHIDASGTPYGFDFERPQIVRWNRANSPETLIDLILP
jgi:hypothetical protein